jgi:hypothetical protein
MDGGFKNRKAQGLKRIKQDWTAIIIELKWTVGLFLKSAGAL